jgi:predicted NBD/HSP70 family sugar kinase
MAEILFGIDLGGTKIEGVVMENAAKPIVLARHRIPTEQTKGYSHIIQQIKALLAHLESQSGIKATKIGIGTPGVTNPKTGLLKNSNTLCLNNQPLQADLTQALGIPANLANDANCFALAEAIWGAGAALPHPPQVVFGVIMGTGVGGGLVVNGKVWNGGHGIAGEWGHNPLQHDGPDCYCGKNGCVEKVISGPALEQYYHKLSGETLTMREIATLAEQGGNPNATATIAHLCHYYGKAMANLINILDPDLIVLGGGVGQVDALYTEGRAAILPWLFNNELETPIMKPALGDSAGVFGAALL